MSFLQYEFCTDNVSGWFEDTQRAHDVKMTSYQRRCDVMCPRAPRKIGSANWHGGGSIDTTCAVVRDVTAYIAVVRVFRFPSEYYGCRYHQCPCFSVHRAKTSSLFSAIITENCQEGIYRYFQRVSNFLNI